MGLFLKTFLSLLTGLLSLTAFAAGHIHVQDPWIRAAPPVVKNLAAYMTIVNRGEKMRKLMRISSPAFARIEIHQSMMENDMARMEHQMELTIPPHGTVALKPGDLHLMLMEAKKPLHVGDSVPLTLIFHNGEEISATGTVRSGQMGDMEGMDHSRHMD